MKLRILFFVILSSIAHAAEKPAPETALPRKLEGKDDPLSLENLLDPGKPVPEILPAPEALPDPPASAGGSAKRTTASSARSELISAANDYRRKTDLFRKGKISRDALKSSAVRVARAAKNYRSMVRR